MRHWSSPHLVEKSPVIASGLFEWANAHQVLRMWHEHSALGQSLIGWASVGLGLLLYWNFYRVCCPEQRFARRMSVLAVATNLVVCGTVAYFRYIA